jgi:hypothetical protein
LIWIFKKITLKVQKSYTVQELKPPRASFPDTNRHFRIAQTINQNNVLCQGHLDLRQKAAEEAIKINILI